MRIHERWGFLGMMTAALAGGCNVGLGDVSYTGGAGPGTGGSTSASSAGTGSGGTGGEDCAAPVSDEFDGVKPGACWRTLAADAALVDQFDVEGGKLAMSPAAGGNNGWFQNAHAPFLYQEVSGNFILVARLNAHIAGDIATAPHQSYNTAGLLVRDPASYLEHESWLLYDIGYQGNPADSTPVVDVGTMVKVTTGSQSAKLPHDTDGKHDGKMAICRIGGEFHLLREIYGVDTGVVAENMPMAKTWTFSGDVQVGLVVGSFAATPDVVGTFDHARFGVPKTEADCETLFTQLMP